jgi:sugar-specific transcriptional regulator TrmB
MHDAGLLITGVEMTKILSNGIDKMPKIRYIVTMLNENDIHIIERAGLTEPQAKTYLALLRNGALTPTKISEITGETRTNTYALIEKLVELNLAEKSEQGKTSSYIALPPSNLELLAEKRRRAAINDEQNIKNNISVLTDIFYAHSPIPGAKTYIGEEGVKEILKDTLRVAPKKLFLIRTTADVAQFDFIQRYRDARVKKGIHTYALTPDTPESRKNIDHDADYLFHRVMIPRDAYKSQVEIDIYGDKVAFIDYGSGGTSTIITSPAITATMRELFVMQYRHWAEHHDQPYEPEAL